jgi:Divergent InlB B-repeat domain
VTRATSSASCDGSSPQLTPENPYVGPRPFEREDAGRFFGRARDARDLTSLVVAHRVVLLYSASGAGKSSLVNAGVRPLLEKRGFDLVASLRVGAPATGEHANAFAATVAEQLGAADGSIAAALEARPRAVDDEGERVPRALVIDQFEELFTAHPELWSHRAGFFDGLREALEADDGLRVLLVMREEYLAQLEPHAQRLPGGLRTRLRLERLDRNGALEAVMRPLDGTGRSFAPGVAESFVDDLLRLRFDTGAGGIVEVMGEYVEPVHLQVVCSRLWTELPAGVTEIRAEHAEALAELDVVLGRFYDEAVAAAHSEAGVSERRVRDWVREQLITPGGTRSTVYRGHESTAGLPNAALKALEDKRLVRAEQRANALWYELTHDRLIGPIRQSNAAFAAARARRRLRQVAVALGAAVALLLAALAAFVTVFPSTRPESAVCGTCSARFGQVALTPEVTYEEYLRRSGLPRDSAVRALDEVGVLVNYVLRLEGKDETFPVTYQVVDANTGNIVGEQGEALRVRTEAEGEAQSLSLWVPRPKQRGLFRITLSVFRPGAPTGSQPLDTATTETFAGESAGFAIMVTFRVLRSGDGVGRVVGPLIDCGELCSAQFEFGSRIRLVATPGPGSVFAGWEGACRRAPTCELTVGPVTSIRAHFQSARLVE